jgi:filamentous hemagglutinin family protein
MELNSPDKVLRVVKKTRAIRSIAPIMLRSTCLNLVIMVFQGFPLALSSLAQIETDNTLSQPSIVNSGNSISTIAGGTQSGTTLFHSFKNFSIPTGQTAVFLPDAVIRTIITRVTGNERSQIDGTLAVNGTANLFLLNPNGISFGPNAQLAISGSFFASTAERVKFSDGSEFSTTQPQVPSLLTLSVPIGVQFGAQAGSIVNQANLQMPNQTIALLGGDLKLEGAIATYGGDILLVSAASPGAFRFDGIPNIQQFGAVELSGNAVVSASGLGGGGIQVWGGTVTLRDRASMTSDTVGAIDGRDIQIQASQLRVQDRAFIRATTSGSGAGSNISIRVDETRLSGIDFASFQQAFIAPFLDSDRYDFEGISSVIGVGTSGLGRSGNLSLETQQLSLSDGFGLGSINQGSGLGGTLNIQVEGRTEVSASGIASRALSEGDAGALTLNTNQLVIREGGTVNAATSGSGRGGELTVQADSILISGSRADSLLFGSNLATTTSGGSGDAGNLKINARSVRVEQGGIINTSSAPFLGPGIFPSSGQAGNITIDASESLEVVGVSSAPRLTSVILSTTNSTGNSGHLSINTNRLSLQDGGGIEASTLGIRQGGTIKINAESIEILGKAGSNTGASSRIVTNSADLYYRSILNSPDLAGAAGNIKITTQQLTLQNQGQISVSSGFGEAGTIRIKADTIALDNQAKIDATTTAGGKGNITLDANQILMRRGSQIRTNAGSSDGGNIQIKTGILAAIPSEDSNITATAIAGRGGNIDITAQGILGLQPSQLSTLRSEIIASSKFGIDGKITLNTLKTEPNKITNLSNTFTQPNAQIAATCAASALRNRFVLVGRGGLEQSIAETLQATPVWTDSRNPANPIPISTPSLVKATNWIINPNGTVTLVSDRSLVNQSVSCGG